MLCALLLAAAGGRAQSNQGGGEQLNPNTTVNSIIGGGATGAATPIDKIIVPVTPASDKTAPASSEKDRPPKRPLSSLKPPARKKLSDCALRRKIRGEIVHDVTLPPASRDVKVGADNVVNLIEVKPPIPAR